MLRWLHGRQREGRRRHWSASGGGGEDHGLGVVGIGTEADDVALRALAGLDVGGFEDGIVEGGIELGAPDEEGAHELAGIELKFALGGGAIEGAGGDADAGGGRGAGGSVGGLPLSEGIAGEAGAGSAWEELAVVGEGQ